MNQKELAEQIAKKHLGILWNELGEGAKGLITAAIIEAMGEKHESEQILLDTIKNLISAGQEALNYSDGSGRPILQEAIWSAKAVLDNLPDKIEAMGVQPGMRWVKASEAPYDTWVLLSNEHFIGVAKRKQEIDREYGEPEWHDETSEYIDTKGRDFYYMPLPPKPNNEQNVQVSDTRNDAQRYVADNQESIEPKGE